MSREIYSLILLLLLISASALNIMAAERLCNKMLVFVERAEICAEDENWAQAEDSINKALEIWLKAKPYTHIFIRHSETDICTDAYYDLLEALASKNADETGPVFSKLRYHIRSIADMEKLRLGNIL